MSIKYIITRLDSSNEWLFPRKRQIFPQTKVRTILSLTQWQSGLRTPLSRLKIEEFYSLLSQCRCNHSPHTFISSLSRSPFLKILIPSRVANHPVGCWWARGTVGKGEICKPKRIRVILLRAFSKSTLPPFSRSAWWLEGGGRKGRNTPLHTTEKSPRRSMSIP